MIRSCTSLRRCVLIIGYKGIRMFINNPDSLVLVFLTPRVRYSYIFRGLGSDTRWLYGPPSYNKRCELYESLVYAGGLRLSNSPAEI